MSLIHLPDRLFAVTLDSLAIVRDELRAKGLTGDECQQALDILQAGVTPTTDGIRFEFVTPQPDIVTERVTLTRPNLDSMIEGYIECALWADCMPHDEECPNCHGRGFVESSESGARCTECMGDGRVSGETGGGENLVAREGAYDRMVERSQIADFYDDNLAKLRHYVTIREAVGMSVDEAYQHAGHDFWLTRNGHGAGFWDRGMGMLGDELTAACKPYGSADDHTPFDCGDGTWDV
jgi:hypothetical protein